MVVKERWDGALGRRQGWMILGGMGETQGEGDATENGRGLVQKRNP